MLVKRLPAKGECGAQLSSTWLTCPWDRDNPGKLGLIPNRRRLLEWTFTRKDSYTMLVGFAQGWGRDRSGCW